MVARKTFNQSMSQILIDIDTAFADDPEIDELGIVMSSPPPNIVLVNHKLGLSYAILKPLFSHTLEHFYELVRAIKAAERHITNVTVVDEVFRLTRAALLVKGDMPMLYNLRKSIVRGIGTIKCYDTELHFMGVLFTKHPKSPSSWQHRRWCLYGRYFLKEQTSSDSMADADKSMNLAPSEKSIEMSLCAKMSESYPKNYYSWMHRLWVLQFLNTEELESELIFTNKWLLSHVSDHSAANHRQQIVLRICHLLTVTTVEMSELPPAKKMRQLSPLFSGIVTKGNNHEDAESDQQLSNFSVKFLKEENFQKKNTPKQDKNFTTENCSRFYRFEFVNRIFNEAKEFVVLRPGNEALWCHLRGNVDLLLQTVFEIVQERITNMSNNNKKNGNDISPSNRINDLSTEIPKFSTEDFKIILDYVNTSHNDEDVKTDGNSALKNTVSEDSSYHFTKFGGIIGTEKYDQKEMETHFLCWIITWLRNENIFCQNNIDNNAAWNYKTNRQMTLRYYSFILFRLIGYCKSYRGAICNKQNNSISVNEEIEIGNLKSNHEEINDNCYGSRTSPIDDFESFITTLQKSSSLVMAQLMLEGKQNFFLLLSLTCS